eukprot:384896_1
MANSLVYHHIFFDRFFLMMSTPASKKRKFDTTFEDSKEQNDDNISIIDLFLSKSINDIFGNDKIDSNKLQEFSDKLELIQKATKKRLKDTSVFIPFNEMDNKTRRDNILKWINRKDCSIKLNDKQVHTLAEFEIGPHKTPLEFKCDLETNHENDISGSISLGFPQQSVPMSSFTKDKLWDVTVGPGKRRGHGIYPDEIKKLVKRCGITGVGIKSSNNNNNRNRKKKNYYDNFFSNEKKQNTEYYGFYNFANDLSQICLNLIEQNIKSKETHW